MRARTLLLLATLATLVPILLVPLLLTRAAEGGGSPRGAAAAASARDRPSPDARALTVLRGWDRDRLRAWASGDPAALARLYVPGSSTGARDAHELRRWVARGLRVTGLRQQVRSLSVAGRAPGRLVVVVTDRTVDGIAVGGGWRTAIPGSAWATHRVTLRRTGDRWRVAEVRAQPAR